MNKIIIVALLCCSTVANAQYCQKVISTTSRAPVYICGGKVVVDEQRRCMYLGVANLIDSGTIQTYDTVCPNDVRTTNPSRI